LLQPADLPQQNAELYALEPTPLTIEQCGQCHPSHFQRLKTQGGLHQFDCRECHTVFHAYNPVKGNYAELMPDCGRCHGQVHGEAFTQCLSCHSDPHAIRAAPAIDQVRDDCANCHSVQGQQLQDFPSRHTELACSACHHSEHGLIPSCADCHQPHFAEQQFTACTACHDVHQPLQISLAGTVELKSCSACHAEIFAKWTQTPSRHGQVGCGECHAEHRLIPNCRACHGVPPKHSQAMLTKFPRCLDCHLDVHDLPVKQ
jgi:hypothetical protein